MHTHTQNEAHIQMHSVPAFVFLFTSAHIVRNLTLLLTCMNPHTHCLVLWGCLHKALPWESTVMLPMLPAAKERVKEMESVEGREMAGDGR